MRWSALKKEFHRTVDPLLVWRQEQQDRACLRGLADGEYRVPLAVPYVPQFASPELIHAYIHEQFDGRADPAWASFGAADPADYVFWSRRVCALAVIRMALAAYQRDPLPTLWELTQQGLAYQGYRVHDEQGRRIDEGWYFHAQAKIAADYGLSLTGFSYASVVGICRHILEGRLVSANVTPELGERVPLSRRFGGHAVLVHGFRWHNGSPTHFILHNPSGRYPELQADALIPAVRFRQSFAYRYAVFSAG